MKANLILIGITMTLLAACRFDTKSQTTVTITVEQSYYAAGEMVLKKKYDSAVVLLKQAYERGLDMPMRIVADSNFYSLIDDPKYRPEIRKLLNEFSIENHASMIRSKEPGQHISVIGRILDESDNKSVKDVHVELVHADNNGNYFEEKTKWNPRLFAYLKTDENGEFRINTIRPSKYQDDGGNDVPAHIHFNLEKEGYRVYASEFTFEDDPVFKANGNIDMVPVAILQNIEGENHYRVTILLQRE